MNTKMLMLGILLIAGLSFAVSYPENWLTYSVNRYGCNYVYTGSEGYCNGDCYPSLMAIVYHYDDACDGGAEYGDYWDCWDMGDEAGDMYSVLFKSDYDMCYAACSDYEGYPNVAAYRSDLLQYNVASAYFRSHFLAGLRAYLADGGDREEILGDLQNAMIGYRECIADLNGPCDFCDWW